MIFYFSLGILAVGFGASLGRRFFDTNKSGLTRIFKILEADQRGLIFKGIFFSAIILIFLLLSYQSFEQYDVWRKSGISKFLLPPYQNISYFLFYVGFRIFAPHLISLSAALVFLWLAKLLNRKYEERFFYPEELWFGAISLFLTGYPGWLFYSVLIIIIYLTIHLISLLITHYSLQRLSLYYLWIPGAIFVIIIQKWLQVLPLWSLLKI